MIFGSLVLGVLNGLTFGLLGVGLVLVYKSNRFLNIAHAQLGTLSAALLAKLVVDAGWGFWPAFVVSVPLGLAVGVAVERLVVRPLRERGASPTTLLLATIGVTQILIGVAALQVIAPSATKLVSQGYPLPFHATAHIGGVTLDGADLLAAILVPVAALALAAFLQLTLLGKLIRAAASNPDAARLCGVSARRVSAIVWGIAGTLSAVTAILQAPSQSTYAAQTFGPGLLLVALGAAAVGAFTSLSLALAGGVALGVLQQLVLAYTSNASDAELATFGAILLVVFVRGTAIGKVFAASGAPVGERPPLRIPAAVRNLPIVRAYRPAAIITALSIGVLVPLLPVWRSEAHRFQLALILTYALIAISATVALGWAGQVSLGQFAVVGAGAFAAGHLMGHGWSVPFLLLPAGLVGATIMVLVGLPAVRVPGLTLAVTTLGLALIAPEWLFRQSWFGTPESTGVIVRPPALGRGLGHPSGQLTVYYIALTLVTVACLGLTALRASQAGRLVVAVRDNEAAVATFGVTPATVKLAALALSGALAGAAGVLWADTWRSVTATQFPAELSLTLLALAVIGGLGSVSGAVAAAVVFYATSFFLAPHLSTVFGSLGASVGFQLILGGVGLLGTVLKQPFGIAGAVTAWWQRRLDRLAVRPQLQLPTRAERPALAVRDVRVHFGGVRALDGASIDVAPGEIVGLIGPNGAGKTTLLNVISGRLACDAGSVTLGDVELSGMPPEMRATFGLGRSFQDAALFAGLTVREVVQVAMSSRYRASMLASSLCSPWVRAAERDCRRAADAITERLGLTAYADTLTGELSTGTRRICDLAAQVAAGPSVLLLDEPAGGVAQREAEAFGPLLRRIREELDCAIVIVEHDMPLLMGLCDRVYAMVAGQVIASGTPDEVRDDPAVIASYLGTDETAVRRSGARKPVRTDDRPRRTTAARGAAARPRPVTAVTREGRAKPARPLPGAPRGASS